MLWEPCARKPGYLAFCVYVCDGQNEENCNKSGVNPCHPLLITVRRENAKLSFYSFLVKKHAFLSELVHRLRVIIHLCIIFPYPDFTCFLLSFAQDPFQSFFPHVFPLTSYSTTPFSLLALRHMYLIIELTRSVVDFGVIFNIVTLR